MAHLQGGLIVSCQAAAGHPLRDSRVIALLARCAELGGAVGVRVNGPADVRAAKAATALPVIGLYKVAAPDGRDRITPTIRHAAELARAGADVVALETSGDTPPGTTDLIGRIHSEFGVPVMADIATLSEGLAAWAASADLVATTVSGYTTATRPPGDEPDLNLVRELSGHGLRTIAEGRYQTPDQVRAAFDGGAYAVVVGTAITDPVALTRRLAAVAPIRATDRGEAS